MPTNPDSDFAAVVRRAGVAIPPERLAEMQHAYERFQELLKVLDESLAYEDEPAQLPRYDGGDRS
jgi:hypothetical protein